jgi:hypothetical protein
MTVLERATQRGLSRLERLSGNREAWFAPVRNNETLAGRAIACSVSSLRRGVAIVIGGNEVMIDLTLFFRRIHFLTADEVFESADTEEYTADHVGPAPRAGDLIRYPGEEGTPYRVVSVREGGPRGHIEVDVADQHSGS